MQLDTLELICECGTPGCTARILIPADDYELLSAAGHRVVVPGHEQGRISGQRDGYVVLAD